MSGITWKKQDIVKAYGAWASPDLFTDIRFEVIACYRDGAGRLHTVDDVRRVNNFVACVSCGDGGGGGHEPHNDENDATQIFRALYLSLDRVAIPTIADGRPGEGATGRMVGWRAVWLVTQMVGWFGGW